MKSTLIAVAALLALTGCGSSTPKPAAAKPSPTPSTATITQYASKMNGPLKGFSDTWNDYKERCLVDGDKLACAVDPVTLNASASTIQVVIDGASKPGGPAFIGLPPAELVKLLSDTYAAAGRVAADTEDGSASKSDLFGDGTSLMGDIDAWGPYLS